MILTRKKIKNLEKEYINKKIKLENRVVSIFKNKDSGWLSFLFMPSKFNELTDSPYYFNRLLKLDIELLENVKHSKQKLTTQKQLLNKQKQRYTSLKSQFHKPNQTYLVKKDLNIKK